MLFRSALGGRGDVRALALAGGVDAAELDELLRPERLANLDG